ncbi:class I SAM-dependent methyltransferase [Patescibacteria group bacterium]|nr:class I SAM-dependent methyltransferase [Patescibacteria group bacterium]
MLGIKTKLKKLFRNKNQSLVNKDKIIDLMITFKADEFGHECNTEKADLGYGWIHYGLLRQQKPKRVLCVGSRHGYIPAVFAQACKDNGFGTVDFVDAGFDLDDKGGWTGVGYWRTKKGRNCFNNFNLGNYITLFLTTTKKFSQRYPNQVYDYIYIDGDHSLKGVTSDFKLFWPKLNRNGYLVFHDICVKEDKPEGVYGVWKLWKKLEKEFKGIKINYLGSGLGIIQK